MSKRELSISEQSQRIITQVHQDDFDEAFGLIKKEERAEPLLSSEGLCQARNKPKETPEQVRQRVQADLNEDFGYRVGVKTGDLVRATDPVKPIAKKDMARCADTLQEALDRYYREQDKD